MLSGIIHYIVGFDSLNSVSKLEMDYLFSTTKLFYVGIVFSCMAFVVDIR